MLMFRVFLVVNEVFHGGAIFMRSLYFAECAFLSP